MSRNGNMQIKWPNSIWAAVTPPRDIAPALRGDTQADVVVIGGGFSGLSTALHLAKRGRQVMLLEAMAVGVPVIGARSGAIPEVIGDGGLVFDEGDVNQLVEALCKVVDDPDLRQQLVAAGQTHVHSRYTQRYVAGQTAAAYRQIMRRATERATGSATEPAEVAQP